MARLSLVIFIVEDEFLLRMDSAEVIENAGFDVIHDIVGELARGLSLGGDHG
jgi:hypothetical protein